jgi:anti-sigma regulatory factor (Ser/Thr protein kinase)/biotin operon repressor
MSRVRVRGENIRSFILQNVEKNPSGVSKLAAEHFKITRQAINKHLQRLTSEGALAVTGHTRNRSYKLMQLSEWRGQYNISQGGLAEDLVWREAITTVLGPQPENVLDIWHYGFTEMFNNAIDHSRGTEIYVHVKRTAINTEMAILDDGIGIFKKIQTELKLLDERHAILELSKGKLTTDPQRHTGEGIFFTSRMFDAFDILSGGVYFSHVFGELEDWVMEREQLKQGTFVWMKLNNHTSRTVKKIFDQYTSKDSEFGFHKTVVPVKLAQYGNDKLISRSQAKRVLGRVELFKVVLFDFAEVPTIGQAFADEIFRVFAQEHPDIQLHATNANSEVRRMIARVKSNNVDGKEP